MLISKILRNIFSKFFLKYKINFKLEITEWELTPDDKFFIIASDGVWEFIESEEVKFIFFG